MVGVSAFQLLIIILCFPFSCLRRWIFQGTSAFATDGRSSICTLERYVPPSLPSLPPSFPATHSPIFLLTVSPPLPSLSLPPSLLLA